MRFFLYYLKTCPETPFVLHFYYFSPKYAPPFLINFRYAICRYRLIYSPPPNAALFNITPFRPNISPPRLYILPPHSNILFNIKAVVIIYNIINWTRNNINNINNRNSKYLSPFIIAPSFIFSLLF